MTGLMKNCRLCPRACGADRTRTRGLCGANDRMEAARASLHLWEEPPISGTRGSGTVFFSHCSLGCVFCQNRQISRREAAGRETSVEALAQTFLSLERQGAHNINLVTGAHYAPQYDETGLLARGTVIRHLMLPGLAGDTAQVLRDIAARFGDSVLVSLMRQYTPFGMQDWPELDRTITDAEYAEACTLFTELGLSGFFQQDASISESFIPAFDGTGLEDTEK